MAARRKATATTAGILDPEEFARHFDLARLPCAPEVSPWVENYWVLRWSLPPGTVYRSSVLPHPACTLSVERGDTRPEIRADPVVVTGVIRDRFDVDTRGAGWTLGIKFRPGGFAAYAGADAAAVTGRVVPARTLVPNDLADALATLDAAVPDDAALAVADSALAAHVPEADPAYDLVLTIVADLLADRDLLRVEQVERRHGIGARRLQRLFSRYVGVSPKWVIARFRMHDAVTELDQGYAGPLADLAARHGWYDQAHFARDFAALTGCAPSAYRARQG